MGWGVRAPGARRNDGLEALEHQPAAEGIGIPDPNAPGYPSFYPGLSLKAVASRAPSRAGTGNGSLIRLRADRGAAAASTDPKGRIRFLSGVLSHRTADSSGAVRLRASGAARRLGRTGRPIAIDPVPFLVRRQPTPRSAHPGAPSRTEFCEAKTALGLSFSQDRMRIHGASVKQALSYREGERLSESRRFIVGSRDTQCKVHATCFVCLAWTGPLSLFRLHVFWARFPSTNAFKLCRERWNACRCRDRSGDARAAKEPW